MSTVRRFEDLLAWRKARELVREAYRSLSACRDGGFKDQIQRAAVSVMSNVAEGEMGVGPHRKAGGAWRRGGLAQAASRRLCVSRGGTREGFLNYLYIAKGSAGEVRAQLYAAYDIGYLNVETFKRLKSLAEECSKLLSVFIKGVKRGARAGLQRKREERDAIAALLSENGYVRLPDGRVEKAPER